MEEINRQKLDEFLSKKGKYAARVLSVLGKNGQFLNALSTPVGEEILRDVMFNLEGLLEKIINEEAKEQEKAEYRAYRNIMNKWVDKINSYNAGINEINNG